MAKFVVVREEDILDILADATVNLVIIDTQPKK